MESESRLLKGARASYREKAWLDAYEGLVAARERGELIPEDLERLATSSYMLGNVRDMIAAQEDAYRGYVEQGKPLPAARVALWVAAGLASRGKLADAGGWVERGKRILDDVEGPCVERGYLLLPEMLGHVLSREFDKAVELAATAVDIGREFNDNDLIALAAQEQGRALLHLGQTPEAFRLLDEAMLSVTSDECTPMVTGTVYCAVLVGCYEAFEIRRAASWTESLTDWCGAQPDLVAFTDQCLAHRSEILRMRGAWGEAITEARRSLASGARGEVASQAHYQIAEIYRMRGDFEAAEAAFHETSSRGGEAQPGLGRLRLAQGNEDAAAASVRRAMQAANGPLPAVRILPGYIDVMLGTGFIDEAEEAASELDGIARRTGIDSHRAWAAHALGTVSLARSDTVAASSSLRKAIQLWDELEAPYELACSRLALGRTLALLGDDQEAAALFNTAKSSFSDLGAAPDVRAIDDLLGSPKDLPFGLTGREIEVLGLVASGATNRAIAESLVLSERTIDRHVSNIFTKLGVSTRSAATALAIRHSIA